MRRRNGAAIVSAMLLLAQAGCGRGVPGGTDPSQSAAAPVPVPVSVSESAVPLTMPARGLGHAPQSGSGLSSGKGSGLGLTGDFPADRSTRALGASASSPQASGR